MELMEITEDMLVDESERGVWLPLCSDEMCDDRHWNIYKVQQRLADGRLKVLYSESGPDRRIYFESPLERYRWERYRTRPAAFYEHQERALAALAEVPYGKEKEKKKRDWLGTLLFLGELLVLPFAIMGMKDRAQWFLGTGEYGKRD